MGRLVVQLGVYRPCNTILKCEILARLLLLQLLILGYLRRQNTQSTELP